MNKDLMSIKQDYEMVPAQVLGKRLGESCRAETVVNRREYMMVNLIRSQSCERKWGFHLVIGVRKLGMSGGEVSQWCRLGFGCWKDGCEGDRRNVVLILCSKASSFCRSSLRGDKAMPIMLESFKTRGELV